jgi:DNA-binding NarL/FixJ family response regulator
MRDKVICIVEDKSDLREAMCLMVQFTEGYLLGGAYVNAEEAAIEIPLIIPDAILMDINLPGSSGIECVARLKAQLPSMLFLMCTAYEDNDKIFSSLKAGATGYILKTDGPAKIMAALAELFDGGSPMSSAIARKVVASFNQGQNNNNLLQALTEREAAVLQCLATGRLNKEVAGELFISEGTVRKHIQHIYEKLQVNTRVEAVNIFLKR